MLFVIMSGDSMNEMFTRAVTADFAFLGCFDVLDTFRRTRDD